MFVSQSGWYDDEYDVLLGNKPRDMLGLDTLADNIISADFPDDDEKFFDMNKFIGLNQGPDTDTGLNFLARQA